MNFLDDEQRKQIGLTYLLDKLEIFTPYGQQEKHDIKPFKNKELLFQEFTNIQHIIYSYKANLTLYNDLERILCKVKDIRHSVKRCENLITLDDVELFEIKQFSMLINELINIHESLNLDFENIRFKSLEGIIELLDPEGKRLPTFHIYDKYSETLRSIRSEKRISEEKIMLCRDSSKLAVIKEQRLSLVLQEEKEELRIRKILTGNLNLYISDVVNNMNSLGKLDFLIAKAKLAVLYKGSMPVISSDFSISMKNAVNPEVLDILKGRNKSFTPVTLELNLGAAVITGANMGGKSVTLKTILLNILLGNMGFFVFAEAVHMPIFDFIHYISNDLQSVSQGLSTFGAEIIRLKHCIQDVKTSRGFVALDEFARGTNPHEGLYLVKGLCRYLNKHNSISVICTHYDGVADKDMTHYQVVGLKNADLDELKSRINTNKSESIEMIQEHMDYRLEKVSAGSSVPKDALNISILLGLQKDLIETIKEHYLKDIDGGL